jgi:tripartite-type tricarboxylate transporter receptor subunit TctC
MDSPGKLSVLMTQARRMDPHTARTSAIWNRALLHLLTLFRLSCRGQEFNPASAMTSEAISKTIAATETHGTTRKFSIGYGDVSRVAFLSVSFRVIPWPIFRPLPVTGAAIAVLLSCLAGDALAQAYPSKVIRFVVASAPGGGSDLVGRTLAQKMAPALGQQIIVENRAGAGGRIGAEVVARAAPDGYTLLIGTSSLMVVAPALYPKLPYDTQRDFAPVSLLGSAAYVLVVHPSVPAKSARELVSLARAQSDKLTYASAGSGASSHLAGELFKLMAGVKIVHVPYRASPLATLSVVAGESDLMFSNILPAVPAIRGGRLRPLGITSAKRSSVLAEVPTIEESGLPGYEVVQLYGLLAPAGTPRDIVRRLNEETRKGMQSADTLERLRADGSEVAVSTPEELEKMIAAELRKWAKVIKQAGIAETQ